MEDCDVATVDIPAAFMQAEMDEIVFMKITGTMVNLLVSLDKCKYNRYTTSEGNKDVLYVRLNKALYGTLRAALLFWKKLSETLQGWGFAINPCDQCVANKEIDGKQCTIIWHVDDLKISHCNCEVVSGVIRRLSEVFGKEAPLTVHCGRIHDYLGMKIDFSKKNKVIINMMEYVEKFLQDSPEDMLGTAQTPASNFLFEINSKYPIMLSKDDADTFHTMVAKLLFLCKRARPDIQTAVSFLCTCVRSPDTDDYKKLARIIKYVRGTKDMVLTLENDKSHAIRWWVDASFACHSDMTSHTGGIMTLGRGAAYATSTWQKLNTRSSTEGELVAVNDVMGHVLWTRNFLL
jgi:Reverse transcriptase (RNA-dependent DNA polymerase)